MSARGRPARRWTEVLTATKRRVSAARAALRRHPRHLALGALVAGLLAGPLDPVATFGCALAAAVLPRRAPPALLAVAAVLGGALLADARLAALDRSSLGPLIGRALDARATAVAPPRTTRSGRRWAVVRVLDGPGRGERLVVRLGAARGRFGPIAAPAWPHARVGATVALRGRLAALAPYERHLVRQGVHAALVLERAAATGAARGGLPGALDAARGRAERALGAGLEPPEAALLRGMVLGEDEAIAERVREDFRRSGLAHLLAVSGQNVMLLAALTLPLAGALGLALRARLLVVLALIAVYVPLAGGGPSIQRAGVMGAAGLVAALAGRPASRAYALLLAAAATLALNPRAAGDPGWQLSFAAVLALLVWGSRLRRALAARGLAPAVADAAAITLAATLGTAPLLAFHFGRVSLASLPANLLAAPAVAPLMWLGMVAAALGQVSGGAAALVNALGAYPVAYVEWLAHVAARPPAASVPARIGAAPGLLAAYAWLGLVVHVRRLRAPLLAGAAVALALLVVAHLPPPPLTPHGLVVSFLDVGQGDATLIQHAGRAILIDTGPRDGPILARLRRAGVRRLDVLVVTHAQADHEGGTAAVLRRYPVQLLLDGGEQGTAEHRAIVATAARRRVRRITPDAGQVLRAGPLALRVLWPRREPPALHAGLDPNQRAIVALLSDGDFDLFLPADAESDVTAALSLAPVEALKVAHHGSVDPGLPGLLARLRPRVAAIEVGARNTYGHPTAQALAALRVVPALYRTDRDGTIRLTVADRELHVATGP